MTTRLPETIRRRAERDPEGAQPTREMRFQIRQGTARSLRLVLDEFNRRYEADASASDLICVAVEELADALLLHWYRDHSEDRIARLLDRAASRIVRGLPEPAETADEEDGE